MIPDEIRLEYKLRRESAQKAARSRFEALTKKVPHIGALCDTRRELVLNRLADCERHPQFNAGYDERIRDIDLQIAALLKELGLDENCLKPEYTCKKCSDTGFIGYPLKETCTCLRQRLLAYKYRDCNVPECEAFEFFDRSIYKSEEQMNQALKISSFAEKYANCVPNFEYSNILFCGEAGLGKTFLMNCIANRARAREIFMLKVTAYSFITDILRHLKRGEPCDQYTEADMLLIDDLGSEPLITNITIEYLFSIINERQIHAKSTVFATNLKMREFLERYGERIFSRVFDSRETKVFMLTGDDLRLNIQKK